MESLKAPDLIKTTEVFLVPSSFLVAALGTADTNLHRAAVSLIGFVVSAMWWISSREALAEWSSTQLETAMISYRRRIQIMSWLPIFFILCWLASLVVHLLLGNQPLGRSL